jgi:hypothetical protein
MKIVINDCYGGFGLSDRALKHYAKIKGIDLEGRKAKAPFFDDQIDYFYAGTENMFSDRNIERNDPALVQTVEELGVNANDWGSELKIVDIPEDVKWQIDEYDGIEWVAEQHRTWR